MIGFLPIIWVLPTGHSGYDSSRCNTKNNLATRTAPSTHLYPGPYHGERPCKIFLSHGKGFLYGSTILGAFFQTKQAGIFNWDTGLNSQSTPPHCLLIWVKWNVSSHNSCSDDVVSFSKQRKEISGEFLVRGTFCSSGVQNQKLSIMLRNKHIQMIGNC